MARYDTLRKSERNKALREYAKEHPDLSYKELGDIFGIDSSRAWRIIKGNKPRRIRTEKE